MFTLHTKTISYRALKFGMFTGYSRRFWQKEEFFCSSWEGRDSTPFLFCGNIFYLKNYCSVQDCNFSFTINVLTRKMSTFKKHLSENTFIFTPIYFSTFQCLFFFFVTMPITFQHPLTLCIEFHTVYSPSSVLIMVFIVVIL